jgi:HPt (histidine-containing phosphotransfer) domain-containing protein
MAGERERCLAAGCDDYRSKPIDRATLVAVARRYTRVDGTRTLPFPGDHDDVLVRLAATFAASLPQRMAAVQAAAVGRDLEALHTLAHQLKGAAGGYGFNEVTAAATTLDHAVKQGDEAAIATAVAALDAVCADIAAAREPS